MADKIDQIKQHISGFQQKLNNDEEVKNNEGGKNPIKEALAQLQELQAEFQNMLLN